VRDRCCTGGCSGAGATCGMALCWFVLFLRAASAASCRAYLILAASAHTVLRCSAALTLALTAACASPSPSSACLACYISPYKLSRCMTASQRRLPPLFTRGRVLYWDQVGSAKSTWHGAFFGVAASTRQRVLAAYRIALAQKLWRATPAFSASQTWASPACAWRRWRRRDGAAPEMGE